jgi:putative endonuclease
MFYWVYILANTKYGTLYVGVTNALDRRVGEHKAKALRGFTAQYGVARLVFFREFRDVRQAIRFEKQLKRWRREWKVQLIEADNPHWEDLYLQIMRVGPLHPALRSQPSGDEGPG